MMAIKRSDIVLFAIILASLVILSFSDLSHPMFDGADTDDIQDNILRLMFGKLPYLVLFLLHFVLFYFTVRSRRYKFIYIPCMVLLLAAWAFWCFHETAAPPSPDMIPGSERVPPDGGIPVKKLPPISPNTAKFFMGMLLISMHLIYEGFRHIREQEKVKAELEKEKLQIQLESLWVRINPHFFMNTMNNIKALVLIDPDKAVKSIDDFSGMMRTVLYEGDHTIIPLADEIYLAESYISLMTLRYDDKLEITTNLPDNPSNAVIHPLVIATFLENSFMHGVRAGKPSFVHLDIDIKGDRLICHCSNSIHKEEDSKGLGIGLDNVRKRLSLVYKEDFILSSKSDNNMYEILLDVPAYFNPS